MSVDYNTVRVQKERGREDYKFTPRVLMISTSTSELSQCHMNHTGEVRL